MTDDTADGLTPHQRNVRARLAHRARAEAASADSSGHEAGPCDPRCIQCALAAHEPARKAVPRVSRGEFRVYDRSTWGPNGGGRT